MIYIFGRISDQKIVETACKTSAVNLAEYKANVASAKSDIASNISAFAVDEKSADGIRINRGDQWEPVWTGSAITGVSFAAYDSKYQIEFKADKMEILADGQDRCTITAAILDAEDNEALIDLKDIYVPVQVQYESCKKKVTFEQGQAQFDLMTARAGLWTIPANGTKIIGDCRVKNQITIDALLA